MTSGGALPGAALRLSAAAPGTRGPDATAEAEAAEPVEVERIEREIVQVNQLRRDAAQLAYDKGVALRGLAADGAHRTLGYASFEAFVEQRMAISGRHARRLMSMVEHFTREQVLELGSERASAVLQYARARDELELIDELLTARPFPGGRGCSELSCRAICAEAKAERARRAIQRAAAAAEPTSPGTVAGPGASGGPGGGPTDMSAPHDGPDAHDPGDEAPQSWVREVAQIFTALGVHTPPIEVNGLRVCVCLSRPQITALRTHVALSA